MKKNAAPASLSATRTRSQQAVFDCYNHPGGALLGWLEDEARARAHGCVDLAACLGVTYGYIHQLKSKRRQVAHISDAFAQACGRYLGVPTVVVKLLAGRITLADFVGPDLTEEELIDRAFRQMLGDSTARRLLPDDPLSLPTAARRPLVLMYAEATGLDVLGVQQLPHILQHLLRAAIVDEEHAVQADLVRELAPA